jgi:hypothetical protein
VVNSPGVEGALNGALLAANPLKASSCDVTSLFFCTLQSEVDYVSSELPGPNAVSLATVDGGIAAAVYFPNPRVQLRVSGQTGLIPFDVAGDVTIDSVQINLVFGVDLVGGHPAITIRSGSVTAAVGSIGLNFPGLDGDVLNIVNTIAQGEVRNIVSHTLQTFVTTNVANVLESTVSALDVVTLPASFEVPPLQSGAPLAMSFGFRFSSLSTTASRMLFGIGTRFFAPAAQARSSLGTPLASDAFVDPSSASSVTEAFHESLRGYALHAMWRGGYFDTILSEGALGGAVPSGAALVTTATLPPATSIRADGRTEIAMGGLNVSLEDPALFVGQLQGRLAGRVSCNSQLSGDAIVFGACTVDEYHFVGDRLFDAATAAQVDTFLAGVLNAMLSSAGAAALPVLPTPAFRLSAPLGLYGLPPDGALGLVGPALSIDRSHYVVNGHLGIR